MSTKSSLSYYEYNTKHEIHIYKDVMTGVYYLEDENSKVKLPKYIAEEFAKNLNKLIEKQKK